MEGRSGNAANANTVNRITFIVTLVTLCLLIIYAIYAVAFKHKRKCVMTADGAVGGHGERRDGEEEGGGAATRSGRFSLTKARANVEVVDKVPDDFKKYKFDMTQTTGVHADWKTSSDALSDMCKMLTEGLAYAIRKGGLFETAAAQQVEPLAFNNARLVIAVAENFIVRFKAAVANAEKTLPWAKEWGPHVCDSATMMAHYLLLEQNATMWEEAVELILKIVKSPTTANTLPNAPATEPVTILKLAGAWILARYMQGSGDSSAKEADYVTAIREAKVVVRHAHTDKGAHMDHGYYASKSVDFGSLKRLCDPKITFFYGLDTKLVKTPLSEWTTVKNIILHPTVKCGNVGILGNNRDLKCDANRTSAFGVRVIPFCGYMRYFTKDRQFSVRAQKPHLAYYVVDKKVDDMAQYWVQYRNVHDEKSPTAAKFPNVGFVHKASQTKLIAQPAPGDTQQTNELMPVTAKSFVMAYKRFGVMYQEYEIKEFGQFAVTESVVVDTAAQTVDIKLKIVSREETEELHYYGAEVKKFVVPAKGTKAYATKTDMATGKSETTELATKDFPGFPLKLDTGIVIKDQTTLKSYLLFDNDVPVVWAPNSWAYELPNLVYNVDTATEIFTFDATANQYMNVKTSLR